MKQTPSITILLCSNDSELSHSLNNNLPHCHIHLLSCEEMVYHQIKISRYDLMIIDYDNFKTIYTYQYLHREKPLIVFFQTYDIEKIKFCLNNGADEFIIKDHEKKYLVILPILIEKVIHLYQLYEEKMFIYHELLNKSKFHSIVKNINEYIYSFEYYNNTLISSYHSPKYYDITGYIPGVSEDIREIWFKMVFHEDLPLIENYLNLIFQHKTTSKIEFRIVHRNGTIKWILNTTTLRLDKNSQIIGIDGIFLDITDRKKMEESLINSERRFRSLIDNGSDIILILNLNATIKFLSPSVKIILGYKPEELLNKNILDLVHPDDRLKIYRIMANLKLKKKLLFTVECRLRTKTSDYCTLESKGKNLMHDKATNGIVINARDITEQKELLKKLEEIALFDDLTGLYNRRGFIAICEQQIKIAKRKKRKLYLFFIDLDNMKKINDFYGHEIGDRALQNTSQILKTTFRESDIIGRIGGDEFVVLVIEAVENHDIIFRKRLSENIVLFNENTPSPFQIILSVGTAFYHPESHDNIDDLLRNADLSMYSEKKRKKIKN